jgi:hypothetical protein
MSNLRKSQTKNNYNYIVGYINLLLADFISSLGDWMVIPIISSLFIYNIDLPAQSLAIVAIVIAAPSVFLVL